MARKETVGADASGPARGGQVALLCSLVAVCDGFDTQSIAFVAPVIAQEWNVELAGFGLVFSAGLLGLAAGAFLLGGLADRLGRKTIILACVALFGLSSLLTTTAGSMPQLAMWRFATGLGLGGVLPNLIALTNESATPQQRNSLVMWMFCGFPLGATIGGVVSAPLIALSGWQGVFVTGGIAPLLLLPLLYGLLPADAASPAADQETGLAGGAGGRIGQLFQQGRALPSMLLWIAFFCNLLVMYLMVNWLPSLLSMVGSTLSVATLSTAMLNLGGIAGAFVLARLINRPDNLLIMALAYAAGAGALLLIALAEGNVALTFTGAALAGSIIVGGQIAMNAIAAAFYPRQIRSTGVGWALGVGRIGSIVGPLVGGWLLGAGWAGSSLVLFAILPTLCAAAALFVLRTQINGD